MRINPFPRAGSARCRAARVRLILVLLLLLAGGAGLTWGFLKYRNSIGWPAADTGSADNSTPPPEHGAAATEAQVQDMRTQKIGEVVYFEAVLKAPDDLRMPKLEGENPSPEVVRHALAGLPRLLPRDDAASAVYLLPAGANRQHPLPSADEKTLTFVGKVHSDKPARLRLLYPTGMESAIAKGSPLEPYLHAPAWGELTATLDFSKAPRLDAAGQGRSPDRPPTAEDLEGRWAQAQAYDLAVRELQAPGFGFYRFARQAVERKYKVPATEWIASTEGELQPAADAADLGFFTNDAAFVEKLAQQRVRAGKTAARQPRTRDIQQLPPLNLPTHPWKQMMGSHTPAEEPLARWVPNDNYYATVHKVRDFLDLTGLLQRWGGAAGHALEPNCRDEEVRARYEKQLCLPADRLVKKLGDNLVRALAITGSDLYWSDGSDVSVLFHVADSKRFLNIVDPFLQESRDKFGAQLASNKSQHGGASIESYVTPLREISLHRTSIDDVVIYSNSLPALHRILDAHAHSERSLLNAEDFRYIRTVFRGDDKEEAGFICLPDAFLRRLLGPAGRIKQQRRLHALASLTLAHHAALFHAWEFGKLPAHQKELLAQSALDGAALRDPESEEVSWDAAQRVAVSKLYGTRYFLTPLVELPIAKVTADEEKDYRDFAAKLERSWLHLLDPASVRLVLGGRQLHLETHIAPEARKQGNEWVRQFLGGQTTAFDLNRLSPRTILQALSAWSGDSSGSPSASRGEKWALLTLEDAPVYASLIDWLVKREFQPDRGKQHQQEGAHLLWRLPLTFGLHAPNDKDGAISAREGEKMLRALAGNFSEEKIDPYRGVALTQIHLNERRGWLDAVAPDPNAALYQARIDDAWYVSLSQDALHHLIDRAVRRRNQRASQSIEVAASASLVTQAVQQSSGAVLSFLEWESHRRALANGPAWYALYRGKLLAADADEAAQRRIALRLLGYVPSSPDGAGYRYDAGSDEVLNARHGSYSRPRLSDGQDEQSLGRQLLGSLSTLRVDLRSRSERGMDKDRVLEEWTKLGAKIKGDSLDLSGTKITDAGLAGLEAVPHLKRLNLRSTALTDAGMAHLADLKDLQTLELAGTRVGDSGLKHLYNLKSLERIGLDDTAVTDRGVAQLRVALPALRTVVRHANHEDQLDLLLQSIARLDGRMEIQRDKAGAPHAKLSFYGARITDRQLHTLEDMELVWGLDLSGARQISDDGIAELEKAVQLRTLDLSRTSAGNESMKHLSKLAELRELNLSDTRVTDSGLASLKGLKKLERLDLGGLAIGDVGLEHLKDLTHLRELSLYFTRVTDTSVPHLQRLTRLEKINLRGTRMTAAGIAALQRALPRATIVRD